MEKACSSLVTINNNNIRLFGTETGPIDHLFANVQV